MQHTHRPSGKFLADLVPRTADPILVVRQQAFHSIQLLLLCQAVYQCKDGDDPIIDAVMQLHVWKGVECV